MPGHYLDDRERWIRKVAPHVVTDLFAGVLHVAHQNAFALLVEVGPFYACDFFLPSRREDREGHDAVHRYGGGASRLAFEEMRHQAIKLVQRRLPVPMSALLGQAKLLGEDQGVAHCFLVQGIVPRRSCHGEDCAHMRKVV